MDDLTLGDIPDNKPVRVFLPIRDKQERYRVSGVYTRATADTFTLLFKAGVLPPESQLDLNTPTLINVDLGGPTLSIEAEITGVRNEQVLLMKLARMISHEQMREFFRVDATTSVISRAFHPELHIGDQQHWSLKGTTIDISGSGLLALFDSRPPADRQVYLEITLPTDEPETLTVLARPIRTQQLPDDKYEVAYHFDDIDPEDRDKIIGCCLTIQRRLLRLKVQVKDQGTP